MQQLIAQGDQLLYWAWFGRIWPVIAVTVILLLSKSKPRSSTAFLILGALVGYGVQSLVGLISISLPGGPFEASSAGVMEAMLKHSFRAAVTSVISGFIAVKWLHNLMRAGSANAQQALPN